MSLDVFAVQPTPEANITDLHAFMVDDQGKLFSGYDASGRPVTPFDEEHRLVISLCVRRSLSPQQATELDLQPYTFRVHVDLEPPVRFVSLDQPVGEGTKGPELEAIHRDRSMQALYGGIVTHPEDIAERVVLEFKLDLADREGQPYVISRNARVWGLLGGTYLPLLEGDEQPGEGEIGVRVGIFDDPFIFPRFFRRNVVGVVTSIPMSRLMPKPENGGPVPILLWATTHKGDQQIDHVGRSLRTQLPRFGHLNDKRPADQVRAITRVHAQPTILEALLGSIVAPLFAHRHYDSVPDVVVYDLRKPPRFPNGRWLEDDVAKTLADAGETLLLELSYAESREFPRATTNDKPFRAAFPFLAEAWTPEQIQENEQPGAIPWAPDGPAIARPNLDNSIWRLFYWIEVGVIVLLTTFLVATLRSKRLRFALPIVSAIVIALLCDVRTDNLPSTDRAADAQPMMKLQRLALGSGLILLLALGEIYALGRRLAPGKLAEPSFPPGRQGPIADDSRTRSYGEIRKALFDPSVSRPYYDVWGDPFVCGLPFYETTFASVTEGLFSLRDGAIAIDEAARRTVRTRGDLRWGADRNGFRRLVHPMGVCLAGTWKIDAAPEDQTYTGYFAAGAEGRVIARYSVGGNHPEGGHYRSLGLVGKIFPPADADPGDDTPRAHFITQEDLGGAFTRSVTEAILTNSPPVTLLNRGGGLFAFLPVIVGLFRADTKPADRQLYEIAELGKPEGVTTSCPNFMRLTVEGPKAAVGDEQIDFRNEILGMIYDAGVPQARRKLAFTIEVSDRGRRTLSRRRVVGQHWTRIGTLTFHEAAASYNGDFVVHFHHPPWRRDRNDPLSLKRRTLRS